MKKAVIILAIILSLTSCGNSPESSESSISSNLTEGSKTDTTTFPDDAPQEFQSLVKVEGDRIIYYNIDDLFEASDIIVVGEFISDTCQNASCQYNEAFKKPVLVDAVSYNTISVKKVIKGFPADTLSISQSYGISNEGELVSFSGLSPMRKGDDWLFFLSYDEDNDTYWCEGDYTGRYPLPDESLRMKANEYRKIVSEYENFCTEIYGDSSSYELTSDQQKIVDEYISKLTRICESVSPEEMGLIDRENLNFKFALYSDLIYKYDI